MVGENSLITQDTFSFTFDGSNEIEASLLGLSLSNIAFVTNEIAKLYSSDSDYDIKVCAFKAGSFEVFLTAALAYACQQSALYTLQDASAIFAILKAMFDIKKCLKGEKPKSVEKNELEGYVRIACPDGTDITAPLGSSIVISNPIVERKISEIGHAALLHNPEGGFRLSRESEHYHYDRDSVSDIAQTTDASSNNPTESYRSCEVTLPIRKVDLLGNAAWSFKYGNKSISAKIGDKDFLAAVHSGENAYKAGDKLRVELTIKSNFSGDGQLISESYVIDRVRDFIPASK